MREPLVPPQRLNSGSPQRLNSVFPPTSLELDRPAGQRFSRLPRRSHFSSIKTAAIATQAPIGKEPHASQKLGRPSGYTRTRSAEVARRGPRAKSRPEPSMEAEKPVFAAMTSGVRTSTARKMALVRCMSSSLDPQNHPSFVRLTMTSGRRSCLSRESTRDRTASGSAVS